MIRVRGYAAADVEQMVINGSTTTDANGTENVEEQDNGTTDEAPTDDD